MRSRDPRIVDQCLPILSHCHPILRCLSTVVFPAVYTTCMFNSIHWLPLPCCLFLRKCISMNDARPPHTYHPPANLVDEVPDICFNDTRVCGGCEATRRRQQRRDRRSKVHAFGDQSLVLGSDGSCQCATCSVSSGIRRTRVRSNTNYSFTKVRNAGI